MSNSNSFLEAIRDIKPVRLGETPEQTLARAKRLAMAALQARS